MEQLKGKYVRSTCITTFQMESNLEFFILFFSWIYLSLIIILKKVPSLYLSKLGIKSLKLSPQSHSNILWMSIHSSNNCFFLYVPHFFGIWQNIDPNFFSRFFFVLYYLIFRLYRKEFVLFLVYKAYKMISLMIKIYIPYLLKIYK